MTLERTQIIQALRKSHLFTRLEDDRLERIADRFEEISLKEGETLYAQGTYGDHFYFIFSGRVQETQTGRSGNRALAILNPGDYFGEEALLNRKTYPTGAAAISDAVLLRLDRDAFRDLLRSVPGMRIGLEISLRSRRNIRQMDLNWLAPGEVAYLAVRKHPFFLVRRLVAPSLLFLVTVALFVFLYAGPFANIIGLFLANGILLAFSVLWAGWNTVDWGNDFLLVTNQRVARMERVAGIYDSRQEAPLTTILSVDLHTSLSARLLGFGDVIVRTYTGMIRLQGVEEPWSVASRVEEQWFRVKSTTRQEETRAMEAAIRRRLDTEMYGVSPVEEPAPAEPAVLMPAARTESWFSRVYTMRFEENGTVTYRKHWFVLIQATLLPALVLAASLAFTILCLVRMISFIPIGIGVVAGTVLSGGAFLWYLYRYLDWRNDIYQVTPDQIVDLEKKPLGNEEKKSAPIDNILSVNYERLGIIGQIFNFGTVKISIGATIFTFDHVHDPSAVQQDIFRRMAERTEKRKVAEASAERERVSNYFAYYYNLTHLANAGQSPTIRPVPQDYYDGEALPPEPDSPPTDDSDPEGGLPEDWQSYPFLGIDPSDPEI